jgi:hypothetical protein
MADFYVQEKGEKQRELQVQQRVALALNMIIRGSELQQQRRAWNSWICFVQECKKDDVEIPRIVRRQFEAFMERAVYSVQHGKITCGEVERIKQELRVELNGLSDSVIFALRRRLAEAASLRVNDSQARALAQVDSSS